MILVINTAGPEIEIVLFWPKKIKKVLKWQSEKNSENLLIKIDKLLKSTKMNLKDLKTIVVNQGPGSFTGLRVGISVANTLGYSLKIPVIGIKNQKEILKISQKGYQKYHSKKFQPKFRVLPYYNFKIE